MKTKQSILLRLSPLALLASLTFFAASCGDNKDSDGDGGNSAGSGDPEKDLVGYWAPDLKQMLAIAKEEVPKEQLEGPQGAMIEKMMTQMIGTMTFEFAENSLVMHGAGEPEKSTFKVKSSDPAAGKLVVEITSKSGVEEGTAIVKGDDLTLIKMDEGKEDKLILNRITEAKFKERLAKAKKLKDTLAP